MYVYLLRNQQNDHKYVGVTTGSLAKRWREHRCAAKAGSDRPLYRAIRKYGEEAFTMEVLATAQSREQLKHLECRFVSELGTYARSGSGYNLTLGGDGLEKLNPPKGESSVHAVLTEELVRFIRDPLLADVSNRDMAQLVQERFGTKAGIEGLKSARNGKCWKHLDIPPVVVRKGARKPVLTEEQKRVYRLQLAKIHSDAVVKSAELRKGKRGLNAKLSEAQVRDIFFAEGFGPKIAAKFGVSKKTVYGIKNRKMHTYMTKDL